MKKILTILLISGFCLNLTGQEVKLNTNLVVESDGTLRMDGNATAFTDLVVPVTAVRLGSGNSPEFVSMKNNGSGSRGVYTFTFENQSSSSNEQEVFFSVQMPHNWKEGTTIYPHVHWSPQTATTGVVVWGFEYSWVEYNVSTPIAFPNTTLETVSTISIANGDVDKHFITPFSAITPSTDQDNISGIIMCRFWRKSADAADTYGGGGTGNAALLSFDIHYEIDGIGSHTEYVK
ncbi:MAG: hypothetical protein IPN08_16315 [Bacteroidales bacterium]|nr:hypothetical protein [Bacteroidales bacterium]